MKAAWAIEMDLRLLMRRLLFATSTEAWGTFEHETTVRVGDMLPTSEDLLLDDGVSLADPEEPKLELDVLEVREDEEDEDEDEELDETEEVETEEAREAEASLAAASWYILARQGLMRLPEMAKKMDDSLDARLR